MFSQSKWQFALPLFAIVLVTGICFGYFLTVGVSAHAAGSHTKPHTFVFNNGSYTFAQAGTTPPTDKQCRQQYGIPCYSPQEMRRAYNVQSLLDKGFTGKGQTIIIIDSFGSPTIKQGLENF